MSILLYRCGYWTIYRQTDGQTETDREKDRQTKRETDKRDSQ